MEELISHNLRLSKCCIEKNKLGIDSIYLFSRNNLRSTKFTRLHSLVICLETRK